MDLQIISGTNRPGNLSMGIATQYQDLLENGGVKTDLLSLSSLPANFLESDLYGCRSESFSVINRRILDSSHVLFIVPEYNGSIPGILKLFIDACDYPSSFKDTFIWMAGLSAGTSGNAQGVRHLGEIMTFLGAEIDPQPILLRSLRSNKISDQGWVSDPAMVTDLEGHVERITGRILNSQS